jgi:hypothetical protein
MTEFQGQVTIFGLTAIMCMLFYFNDTYRDNDTQKIIQVVIERCK